MADVLLEELTKPSRRPSLQELQDILILGGHGSPIKRVLSGGWDPDEAEDGATDKLRARLTDEGVPGIDAGDDAHALVDKVRRWAIAQTLIATGLDAEAFPAPYDEAPAAHGHGAHRVLAGVLAEGSGGTLADDYLVSVWEDVLADVEDPWSLVECPVDGALEHRLWSTWLDGWDDGAYEDCRTRAQTRTQRLEAAYGIETPAGAGSATFPWAEAWRQGEALAELAVRLDTWSDDLGDVPVHKLYGADEDGTWRIDRAVREIITSGVPEAELPGGHPARDRLSELRSELADSRYLDYLEQLADETATQLRTGELLEDLPVVRRFWTEHRDEFATGPETVIFYIDALRLDLAHELAEKLRNAGLQVKGELWAGILPSETEFGMGALTPGDVHTFEVDLVDGKLRALRNRKKVDTATREKLLENEGWSIAKGPDDGWQKPRVAYFDTEIDDIGETDLDEIEHKLADRVDRLAEFIATQIERGKWDRAFVVADHGFVLLPEGTTFEKIDPPDGAKDVKRRRFAGDAVTDDGVGLVLDEDTRYMGHLSTPVKALVNPLQRFRKQAITDSRYYHGGALPQEFILNFLRIDRT